MSENLSLLLFMILIYSYFEESKKRQLTMFLISSGGLLLTRYATAGLVFGSVIVFLANLKAIKKSPLLILLGLIIPGLFFEFVLRIRGASVLPVIERILSSNDPFFGFRFIGENIFQYSRMLIFSKGMFLWQNIGISNAIFMTLFFASSALLYRKREMKKASILMLLFLAQLLLQLVFYLADARYLIYTIPLIALGIGWLLDALPEKRKLLVPLVIAGILLQLFTQRSLIKEIVANNLLGRSTAWQYEAVLHFNNHLEEEALIITALPPFLVDVYQTTSYRVLPMSHDQEFLSKKQYVWGDDINYADLRGTYREWLEEGRELYISNAYITHQQSVIEDYESYKESFEFEIMAEGCDQACNIYRLSLK
jgi:hypothetical protein